MKQLFISRVIDIVLLVMLSLCLIIVYKEHELHKQDLQYHQHCQEIKKHGTS